MVHLPMWSCWECRTRISPRGNPDKPQMKGILFLKKRKKLYLSKMSSHKRQSKVRQRSGQWRWCRLETRQPNAMPDPDWTPLRGGTLQKTFQAKWQNWNMGALERSIVSVAQLATEADNATVVNTSLFLGNNTLKYLGVKGCEVINLNS